MNGVANSGLMEIPAATRIFAVSTAEERCRDWALWVGARPPPLPRRRREHTNKRGCGEKWRRRL